MINFLRADRPTLARRTALVGGLLLALCLAQPAQAFRCGTQLVQEGDRKHEVLEKCGEPDFRDRQPGVLLPGVGPVNVTETWYYNPGPHRLLRILTFHQGRLRSRETGGRGFNESEVSRACRPHELSAGMSKYELLSRCGEPIARDSWLEHAGGRFRDRHSLSGRVLVEEWTYVFGSNRFRRHIRIIDGQVVDIEPGAKGG